MKNFKIFFKKVLTSIKKHGILIKLSNEAVKNKRKSSKISKKLLKKRLDKLKKS